MTSAHDKLVADKFIYSNTASGDHKVRTSNLGIIPLSLFPL
jgi:hypothetical protein